MAGALHDTRSIQQHAQACSIFSAGSLQLDQLKTSGIYQAPSRCQLLRWVMEGRQWVLAQPHL